LLVSRGGVARRRRGARGGRVAAPPTHPARAASAQRYTAHGAGQWFEPGRVDGLASQLAALSAAVGGGAALPLARVRAPVGAAAPGPGAAPSPVLPGSPPAQAVMSVLRHAPEDSELRPACGLSP
jgi:hypothetical protein